MFALEGDYYRAITQYELYLMRHPPRDEADAVRLKIAWLYMQAEKLPAAAEVLKRVVVGRAAHDRIAVWARLYYGDVALLARQGEVAKGTYERLLAECRELVKEGEAAGRGELAVGVGDCQVIEGYARLGMTRYYASVHDFDQAVAQLELIPKESPLRPKTEPIAAHVKALKLPRKRPALAGALSVVPGLGHIYIEEYGAATVAMVWNGAFIWAFVDSLLSRKFGQAALIGVVELVWYSGTVFGAVAGAHRFNRDARRIVEDGLNRDLQQLGDQLPWTARFPAPTPTTPQLSWEWRF